MTFWRKKQNKIIGKVDVLHGLEQRCTYFEKHIQEHELFRPEYEVSKIINSILTTKNTITKPDVIAIVQLLDGIDKVDHYDGSGWYDYQIS